MLEKAAIVVFVRNEFPDFCTWIAWYFAIGIDTIIVYDDHSSDGTWEAALAASRCLDVRVRRTDLTVQPFTARQRDVYLSALREFRHEFDWIGFFDADEFLHLRHGFDLPSFLAQFQNADAVAINWCIYGSNGHLLKPLATTVEAFTRHSLASFEHNRSVKTFVRPKAVVDRWRDPHTFDIDGRSYVDAQGQPVAWGGPGGISHDPDWSSAKLMHFIPKSMEHFIERIHRRSDLQGLTNAYWNVFDKNEVEDLEPLEKLPKLHRLLFNINTEILIDYCDSLSKSRSAQQRYDSHQRHVGSAVSFTLHLVYTCFDTVLAVNEHNQLVHQEFDHLAAYECNLVYAVVFQSDALFLVAPYTDGPLRVPDDYRVSDIIPFQTTGVGERAMNLKIPKRQRYLTALPIERSGIGATSTDRWDARDWERFTLKSVEDMDHVLDRYPGLKSIYMGVIEARSVLLLVQTGAAPTVCAAVMQLLLDDERRRLLEDVRGPLPSWV